MSVVNHDPRKLEDMNQKEEKKKSEIPSTLIHIHMKSPVICSALHVLLIGF